MESINIHIDLFFSFFLNGLGGIFRLRLSLNPKSQTHLTLTSNVNQPQCLNSV